MNRHTMMQQHNKNPDPPPPPPDSVVGRISQQTTQHIAQTNIRSEVLAATVLPQHCILDNHNNDKAAVILL